MRKTIVATLFQNVSLFRSLNESLKRKDREVYSDTIEGFEDNAHWKIYYESIHDDTERTTRVDILRIRLKNTFYDWEDNIKTTTKMIIRPSKRHYFYSGTVKEIMTSMEDDKRISDDGRSFYASHVTEFVENNLTEFLKINGFM